MVDLDGIRKLPGYWTLRPAQHGASDDSGNQLRLSQVVEHSQKFLLQAQVDYWREMIDFNRSRIPVEALLQMRRFLAQAMQELEIITSPSEQQA